MWPHPLQKYHGACRQAVPKMQISSSLRQACGQGKLAEACGQL